MRSFNSANARFIAIAAIPLIIVQATRSMSKYSIATSSANSIQAPADSTQSPANPIMKCKTISAQEQELYQWLSVRFDEMPSTSPMDGAKIIVKTPAPPIDNQIRITGPTDQTMPVPTFKLKAVMGGTSKLAVINGKIYRIGEDVAPGWTLVAIESDPPAVRISTIEGQEVRIRLQR